MSDSSREPKRRRLTHVSLRDIPHGQLLAAARQVLRDDPDMPYEDQLLLMMLVDRPPASAGGFVCEAEA